MLKLSQLFLALRPPSTGIAAPVIYEAEGSTKESVICATSSGFPNLFNAVLRRAKVSFASKGIFSVIPVCIGPGHTALTVTPSGPNSTANALVRPTTPCLEAV